MSDVVWYKVIDVDNNGKYSGFDFTKYLPKGKNGKGKWLPEVDNLVMCESGYHVTRFWNMWYERGCRVFIVEPRGLVDSDASGVVEKHLCSSFRFISEVFFDFDDKNNTGHWNTGDSNTGDSNTGDMNTGDSNTGDSNTGHWNTGDSNTGDSNTGDMNTGDSNTGNWNTGDDNTGYSNTGDSNTGHRNTGDSNTGHRNTGDSNTGHWNTGNRNTGDSNTGHRNTGHRNTGRWNISNKHTGCFNTEKPKTVYLFDKPISFEDFEEISFPDWFYFELLKDDEDLHKSWKQAFNDASVQGVKDAVALPNFDFDVFERVTGISKKMIDKKRKVKVGEK